jgi:hypothetical protein
MDVKKADLGLPKFLLIGTSGSGKTTQILTMPRPCFVYGFDPSILSTISGHDVDYEMFVEENLPLGAQSLSKGKGEQTRKKNPEPTVYQDWEEHFYKMDWTKYKTIAFDSFTTFSDIVMDRILWINGRPGKFPERDDWAAQMQTIKNVVRTFTAMNKYLLFTAHDSFKQDETTTRMQNVIMLTGQLRTKLPLLFSDILHMSCESTAKDIRFQVQTRPDRMNPTVRCSFEKDMFEDVTIRDWKTPGKYGIGSWL